MGNSSKLTRNGQKQHVTSAFIVELKCVFLLGLLFHLPFLVSMYCCKQCYPCFLTTKFISKTQSKKYVKNTSLVLKSNFLRIVKYLNIYFNFFSKILCLQKNNILTFLLPLESSEQFLLLPQPGLNCRNDKWLLPK